MIYLFIGQDTFSRREAVERLKESLGPPESRDANTTELSGADITPQALLAACQAVPFLADRRLVLVHSLLEQYNARGRGTTAGDVPRAHRRDTGEWEGAVDLLKALPPSTDLVFLDEVVAQGNPLLATLAPVATLQQFAPLQPDQLRRWLVEQAGHHGATLSPSALSLLADLVGPDLWTLRNELEKLSLWAAGRTVMDVDVTELVSSVKEVRIFSTIDAIVERNVSLALTRLHTLLSQGGTSPVQVLGMLGRQVRLMLLAQELVRSGAPPKEMGGRLGLSGFPLQKTLEQARRYSWAQLMWLHDRLLATDVAIKTSTLEEETALEVLVAEVCSPPGRSGYAPGTR